MSNYDALDDALALIGTVANSGDVPDDQFTADIISCVNAETAEDWFNLVVTVASLAAGLAAVVGNGDARPVLANLAATRQDLESALEAARAGDADADTDEDGEVIVYNRKDDDTNNK